MKKIFTLTLLVFILFLAACQNNPVDPTPADEKPSAAEVEGIPLIVELRTSSTWSDLKILNTDLILSSEITSLIGDPSYFDLEDSTLAVEQSQESAANREQVGLIASLILDESAVEDDVDLEFDLTKDCSNQSTISIYGVVEDQPRMIYQRDLGETEDCGGVAFSMGIAGRLAAMETIGSANFAREEIVFRETEPPTIMNGLEIEFVTRSELSWMEGIELPSLEVLALVGEIEDFGHGNDMVFDLGQSEEEAQLGKWVGGRVRLEYDLEAEDQILDFTLHRGCTNETILQFFRVVEGERFPIPNLDNTYNTTIFECVDPIQVQVDLNKPQVDLRYFVLEKGHLDEGDKDAKGQIFLEAELSTNSNWAEIRWEDERVISSEMLSVAGDPTRVHVNLDTLKVEQPNSSAGSGLEMGVVARYGFIPGDDPVIPLKLDNGCLNQASIRFFANLDGKIVAIPLEGDQESLTAYGCEARDFTLDLEMVQAIIRAAELYDDLPLVAHLSDITGEVLVRQPGMEEFYPAREGTPLNVGGELLTGANAEVYLTVSDGAVIRLGPNTIFGLEMGINSEEIIMPRFRLELGEMELASGSDGFLIITPKEVLGAIGSAALVTVSPEGEAEMDCLAGDCFVYDGTDDTAGVKDNLPDAVAAALDVAGAQIEMTGKPTDTDSDGVPNERDRCPDEGDQGYGLDVQGCPINELGANYYDADGDGIPNAVDHCDWDGDEGYGLDAWGCPKYYDGMSDMDYDADGIRNDMDVCPWDGDQGFGLTPIGCPIYGDGVGSSDSDGDGLGDEFDLCPLDGDQGYGVGPRGCPKNEDGSSSHDPDGDGIPYWFDVCPNSGDEGYGLDAWGCPKRETGLSNADYDGDGIRNDSDLCPNHGDQGYGLDALGCPLEISESEDADGDSVLDINDLCPASGNAGYGLDPTGCPIHPDSDGDGIPDINDSCPDSQYLVSGVDRSGCPYLVDRKQDTQDWDGDGFYDYEDRCPTLYAPFDHNGSFLAGYGCPDGDFDFDGVPDNNECVPGEECLDRDGDGVPDTLDDCPDIPWTATDANTNHSVGTNGCINGDIDKDGVPDDLECEDCMPPGTEESPDACLDLDQDGICVEDDLCPFVAGSLINKGCKAGDSDGDGVRDGVDLCPGVVDPLHGVTPLGCPRVIPVRIDDKNTEGAAANTPVTGDSIRVYGPAPQLEQAADKDNDGYVDAIDQCPNKGDQGYGLDLHGCPLPPLAVDADGDGFADDHDQCPNQGDQGYGLGRDGCPLPAPADSDGDGIVDTKDTCPKLGDQGAGLRDNGCPVSVKATTDPDGDGIVGSLDKCPEQGGDVGLDGCPKQAGDSDGDGVPDDRDSCPNQGNLGYGISRDGCPLKPPDTDGDGVADNQDRCPNKGDQGYGLSSDGCPVGAPDSDGDGVNDSLDKCPDKGDAGFGVDRAGCPLSNPNPPTAIPAKDSDGDGINDSLDKCPNEGDAGYGINARGCPNPAPEPTAAPVEPTAAPPPPPPKPTEAPPEPTSEPN